LPAVLSVAAAPETWYWCRPGIVAARFHIAVPRMSVQRQLLPDVLRRNATTAWHCAPRPRSFVLTVPFGSSADFPEPANCQDLLRRSDSAAEARHAPRRYR